MANVLTTDFNYTYPGQLATEMFYQPSVSNPIVTGLFKVITGVKSKRQLPIPQRLEKVVRAYSNCTLTETGTTEISNRTLEVCKMYFHVSECEDVFTDTYLEEQIPDGLSALELGPFIDNIVKTLIVDALTRDNFRIFSFGDTNDDDTDWNQCDGLWTKILADYETLRVGGDITALNQTAGTRALDYLQALKVGAPTILKQVDRADKAFYVTGNIYENLEYTYANVAAAGGFTELFRNGEGKLSYAGIEIIPLWAWDNALTDTTNPYYGIYDVLMLYSTRDNNVIGVGTAADQEAIKQYFSEEDDKIHWKGKFNMGYQYIHAEFMAVSYGLLA